MKELLRKRVETCTTLPSLPAVAYELLDLCQDESVSLRRIGEVVGSDPALSAKMLRVANSAFYSLRFEVTNISHAVTLLGVLATRTLALSFSLLPKLERLESSGFDHQRCWRRSLISALAARKVGLWANLGGYEDLFLAGLLQDIGMLVLIQVIPKKYESIVEESQGDHFRLLCIEEEKLGVDHAEVGAWLAKRWNLPESLQKAMRGSHALDLDSVSPEHDKSVLSVALASMLAEVWANPAPKESSKRAQDAAAKVLQMSEADYDSLLYDISEALPDVSSLFEIEMGELKRADEILHEAKEALVTVTLQSQQQASQMARTMAVLASKNRELEAQHHRDALTGLHNRAYLDEFLPQAFMRACQMERPLSVVFCDLDRFKDINDTHGHAVGDKVLQGVADCLGQFIRKQDLAVRFAGDEFVVVLPDTCVEEAEAACERVRQALAEWRLVSRGQEVKVTASLGYATHGTEYYSFSSAKSLLQDADRCLYEAKEAGRNCVVGGPEVLERRADTGL